jgi:hypothetical protein
MHMTHLVKTVAIMTVMAAAPAFAADAGKVPPASSATPSSAQGCWNGKGHMTGNRGGHMMSGQPGVMMNGQTGHMTSGQAGRMMGPCTQGATPPKSSAPSSSSPPK